MPTSPRRARFTRRFSSSSVGATWNNKYSQLSSAPPTVPRGRRQRRTSSVGRYAPHPFSDSSDVGERDGALSPSEESDTSHEEEQFAMDTEPRPLIYASLPPSPISSPSTPQPLDSSFPSTSLIYEPPFSLWDYLREELLATDFDSHQELKWERVSNFLSIPLAMEKVSLSGINQRLFHLILVSRLLDLDLSSVSTPSSTPSQFFQYASFLPSTLLSSISSGLQHLRFPHLKRPICCACCS